MHTDLTKKLRPKTFGLVVALFADSQAAHGALADLRDAGFSNGQISIALSVEGKQAQLGKAEADYLGQHAVSETRTSLVWKLRRGFEHDLHRSGTAQMAGQDKDTSSGEPFQNYSEIDLRETLQSMGVTEDRILLLNREITEKGVLLLVEAGDRSKEAESIMERNSGKIRTDTATEHPHSAG
jgi:Heat induced stress protein YflT